MSNETDFFGELGLLSRRKRFERVYDVRSMAEQFPRLSEVTEDAVAVLLHVASAEFIKSLWSGHGEILGVTDVEIWVDCFFVVMDGRIIEIRIEEKDITTIASVSEGFFVCHSVSFSSVSKEALDKMHGSFIEFLNAVEIDRVKEAAREYLGQVSSVEAFSVEVQEFYGLEEE